MLDKRGVVVMRVKSESRKRTLKTKRGRPRIIRRHGFGHNQKLLQNSVRMDTSVEISRYWLLWEGVWTLVSYEVGRLTFALKGFEKLAWNRNCLRLRPLFHLVIELHVR